MRRFVRSRWRGDVPLALLFWRDMLLCGSALNLVAALAAFLLLAAGVPTALAALVFFSPLPVNVFLAGAVWRTAAGLREPWLSITRLSALLWFVAAVAL